MFKLISFLPKTNMITVQFGDTKVALDKLVDTQKHQHKKKKLCTELHTKFRLIFVLVC